MRKSPFIAALMALLTVSSGAAAAERPRSADGHVQDVVPVAPGVWAFIQPGFQVQPVGNVTLIEQSGGLVLVDSGGSPGSARRIVAEIRRLSPKPVTAVIITHWHGDHPQGLSEILRAWPEARTIATRATQAHLRDPKTMNTPAVFDPAVDEARFKRHLGFETYSRQMAKEDADPVEQAGWSAAARLFAQYAQDMRGAVTLSTTESFGERLDLADPRTPIEVHFLGRANTDGDAIVWLPAQKVLIAGDVVVAPIPFGFGSYPSDWIGVLERISAYDFKVLVPGHGSPQGDRAYLDRLRKAIEDVRTQVAALAVQGVSLEEVRKRLDFTDQANAFVGDDVWLRRWFREYWIWPLSASAFKEAKREPIVQSLEGG